MKNKKSVLIAMMIGILSLSSILAVAHSNEENYIEKDSENWMIKMHNSMRNYLENDTSFDQDKMHDSMVETLPQEQRNYHESMHNQIKDDTYKSMSCHG
jgi:predicted nucleotide-binding protein (sugar kinase/HSP70/actin superfamily)